MSEIDVLLSASLKRLAPSGDTAGVADTIRSRVDAGAAGAPATTSGFGGLLPAVSKWLPWVALVVLGGIVGGVVGASGLLAPKQPEPVLFVGVLDNSVTATGCPGGAGVVDLERGTRVLAVVRTDDSAYLGVRDPLDLGSTVWLPAGVVVVDEGQPAVSTLPVDGCPVPTLLAETAAPAPVDPAPAPTTPQAPTTPGNPAPPPPPPPSDTTPPGLGQASGSPTPFFYNAEPFTITAFASDNVGVSAVLISWSGAVSGSSSMSNVGGSQWQYVFSTTAQSFGPMTFTMVARDSAGNQSAPVTVVTSHNFFG